MTISTTYTPNAYAGDGSTTSFAVTFAFLSDADNLKVSLKDNTTGVITVQTVSTHYNVSGSNVVFVTAPASGKTVLVELSPSYLQESDYRENGSLPAEVLEADLDLLKLESQLNKEKADAALRLDPVVAATLTSNIIVASNTPLTNAGKFVRFNAAGTGFEVQTLSATAGLGDVIDDVTPQLGGDLDLNGSDITGTGNIDITGIVSATSISGGTPVLGTADEVQLRVKGHSTQTANILEVRNNADGLSLGIDTSGNAYINGNITVGGTVDGRDLATDGTKLDGIEALADVTDLTNVSAALAGSLTAATVAADDKVLIQDTSGSNALKTVTAQSIADLATGASVTYASQAEMEAASSTTVAVNPAVVKHHPGVAKAWVNFNGTGTVAIRASYNVTSVTDNNTGEYTINFTTAMSSTNYTVVASQSYSGTNVNRSAGAITFATGSVKILIETSAGTRADSDIVCATVFGDM
jgi:hypothetical protein